MDLSGRLFNKQIARATLKILFDGLNDKMDEMEPAWDEEDEDFLLSVNRPMPDWSVEPIEDQNFYEGNNPGLINSPIEYYPSVAVFCHEGMPTNSSDDTGEGYSLTMDIEMVAKSGSFTEDFDINLAQQVSMRLQRMQEATMLVLLENRTLNNTVSDIPAPRFSQGDVFVRRIDKGKNPKFYWQGGVMRYNIYKYVQML
jgi:hypothetical protein